MKNLYHFCLFIFACYSNNNWNKYIKTLNYQWNEMKWSVFFEKKNFHSSLESTTKFENGIIKMMMTMAYCLRVCWWLEWVHLINLIWWWLWWWQKYPENTYKQIITKKNIVDTKYCLSYLDQNLFLMMIFFTINKTH